MPERNLLLEDDEETRRCRRVRQELYARFKTPDEMCAWLMSLEKQDGGRRGKARSYAKLRPIVFGKKAADRKAVRKA